MRRWSLDLQLLLNAPLLSRLFAIARLELDGEASLVAFASLADQQVRPSIRVASQLGQVASHLALLVRASILDANGTLAWRARVALVEVLDAAAVQRLLVLVPGGRGEDKVRTRSADARETGDVGIGG